MFLNGIIILQSFLVVLGGPQVEEFTRIIEGAEGSEITFDPDWKAIFQITGLTPGAGTMFGIPTHWKRSDG